jgi:hypothetical protein
MHKVFVALISLLLLTVLSCQRPARSGRLIEMYRNADCVTPSFAKGVQPPTRGWDATITIIGGSKATIQGVDMVSGTIDIRYEPDGPSLEAVDPGDYIYPSDVRVNASRDRLYVKAQGSAAGIWEETWLYEYDLRNRKQAAKQLVHPDVLPAECPMPKEAA